MKKKILAICLIVSLLAIAVVGGTLAYFTDTKTETNTFTVGNVKIELHEYKDADKTAFADDEVLNPGVPLNKFVEVENVGANSAYIRVTYKVDKASSNVVKINIPENAAYTVAETEDDTHYIYTVTYTEPVAATDSTAIINSTVGLVPTFDWVDDTTYSYVVEGVKNTGTDLVTDVVVIAEAIQSEGIADAATAWTNYDNQVSAN